MIKTPHPNWKISYLESLWKNIINFFLTNNEVKVWKKVIFLDFRDFSRLWRPEKSWKVNYIVFERYFLTFRDEYFWFRPTIWNIMVIFFLIKKNWFCDLLTWPFNAAKSAVQLPCRKLPAFRTWSHFYDTTFFFVRNLSLKLEMLRYNSVFRCKKFLFSLSQFSDDIWFQKLSDVPPNGLYWQYGWLASFEGKNVTRIPSSLVKI